MSVGHRISTWRRRLHVAAHLLLAVLVVHAFAASPATAFPSMHELILCPSGHDHVQGEHLDLDDHAEHGDATDHPHKSHPAGTCCTMGCGPAVVQANIEFAAQPFTRGARILLPNAWAWQDTIFQFDRPPRLTA